MQLQPQVELLQQLLLLPALLLDQNRLLKDPSKYNSETRPICVLKVRLEFSTVVLDDVSDCTVLWSRTDMLHLVASVLSYVRITLDNLLPAREAVINLAVGHDYAAPTCRRRLSIQWLLTGMEIRIACAVHLYQTACTSTPATVDVRVFEFRGGSSWVSDAGRASR